MRLVDQIPWDIIKAYSAEYEIDPFLIGAICLKESGGNTYAFRFEPNWRYAFSTEFFSDMVGSSVWSERHGQMCSWGIMQVMGTVARENGFNGWFTELCEPDVGINYGCKYLKTRIDRYPNVEDAIAAYNAGSVIKDKSTGDYINRSYIDGVLRFMGQLSRELN